MICGMRSAGFMRRLIQRRMAARGPGWRMKNSDAHDPQRDLVRVREAVMESHVVITDKLLSEIHFSKELSHVREWAASHHELLDGSGYPKHLTAEQIPHGSAYHHHSGYF